MPVVRDPIGELLVACARAHVNPAELGRVEALRRQGGIAWDDLIRTAGAHGVVPLLHDSLNRAGPQEIPAEQGAQLSRGAQQNAQHNLLLMRELLKLLGAMEAEKIRVIPLKGPLLALTAYGDISLRQCGDLDILVPQRQLEQASAVLTAAGYRLDGSDHEGHAESEEASALEYHRTYLKDDGNVIVELHWQVVGDMLSFAPDPDDLWNRTEPRQIAGNAVHILSPEDALLTLCAHGMKHFWTRLCWVCDVAEVIHSRPSIDFDALLARSRALGAEGMTLLGLILAHHVLGAAVPPPVLAQARRSVHAQAAELDRRLFDEHENDDVQRGARMQLAGAGLAQTLLFHLRVREKWGSGVRYVLYRAFTPTTLERDWVRLPRWLSFLYYAVRPVRLLCKYGPLPIRRRPPQQTPQSQSAPPKSRAA